MKRIWRTHTGSAPGCQDTPTETIRNWFGNEPVTVKDARDAFTQMLEYYNDAYEDEDHRCFNRREYALTLDDVRDIIRKLKQEATNA